MGVVLACLAVPSLTLAAQQPPPPITALRAGTLMDGTGAAPVKNAVILVQGECITAVGASVPIPTGATVVDLSRATVLPGFIDAHAPLVTGNTRGSPSCRASWCCWGRHTRRRPWRQGSPRP